MDRASQMKNYNSQRLGMGRMKRGSSMDKRNVRIAGLQQEVASLRMQRDGKRGGRGGENRSTTTTTRNRQSAEVNGMASSRPSSRAGTSRLPSARVEVVPKPADGSCLFHSMAHGLNDGTGGPELRQQIAGFIKVRRCTSRNTNQR
jgi:hypothetical protein